MNWSHKVPFLLRVHENRSHMVNVETSADSPVCTPPSVTAILAAIVAAATVWWAAHGLLPLCTPLHTPFACPPAPPSEPPSMAPTETQHKIQQGEVKPENPSLQDQILDPEQSKVLQAQHSVLNSPGVSSSESEEKGDTNVNTASKATNDEMNQAVSNSPAAGGDLQSANLDSATKATTHDYWRRMLVGEGGRAWWWWQSGEIRAERRELGETMNSS